MNVKRVPVLIVGAGVGGLATSALLAKQRVDCLLVERRREVFIYPKARNISFRTLEILRRLGVGDTVHAVAERATATVDKATLNSATEEPEMGVNALVSKMVSEFEGLSPEPAIQFCPQSRSEPILLAEARRLGAQVRYGTELSSFEQDEDGVTAVLRDRDSENSETLRADYLVAADGVHSPVREALGVSTSGSGLWPLYSILIYFRAPWRKFVPHLGFGDAVHVKNADVDGLVFPADEDDLGVFGLTYFPGRGEAAEQFTPQRCHELILKAVGEQIPVEIIDIMRWQPAEQVAVQFQCGRVFLVGDSAHTMPPFRAGGANVAVQSADNLAWKLAAVVNGVAGPALLTTYHAERHPIGRFSARQSCTGPQLEMLRFEDDSVTLPPEEKASNFAVAIGYQYRSAAIVNGDAGADPDAVLLVECLRAQPGTRVPHVWVQRAGQRFSTLDLLGSGFILLTGDGGAPWREAAAATSAALGVPIGIHRIGPEGDVVDADGKWAQATGLAADGAVLVRPDDFVGWRADNLPADPEAELRRGLSAILART